MSAKIIRTEKRPSLDHIFFKEWRSDELYENNDVSDGNYTRPLATTWVEKISFEEITYKRHELRVDWYASLFNQDKLIVTDPKYTPIVNPFSLSDTRIRTFNLESDMQTSINMLKHVPRYVDHLNIIRRLENTITLQLFVDDNLIETIEFK
jgi:hypothetical protein